MSPSSLRSFWLLVAVHVALWVVAFLTLSQSDVRGYPHVLVVVCRVLLFSESMLLLVTAAWWPTSNWTIRALLLVAAAVAFHGESWNRNSAFRPHDLLSYFLSAIALLTPLVAIRWTGYRVRAWEPDKPSPSRTRWQFSIRQLLIWTTAIGILFGTRLGHMDSFGMAIVATVWITCFFGLRVNNLAWRWPSFFVPWIALTSWIILYPPPVVDWRPTIAAVAFGEIAWVLLNVLWIRSLGYRLIGNTSAVPSRAANDC